MASQIKVAMKEGNEKGRRIVWKTLRNQKIMSKKRETLLRKLVIKKQCNIIIKKIKIVFESETNRSKRIFFFYVSIIKFGEWVKSCMLLAFQIDASSQFSHYREDTVFSVWWKIWVINFVWKFQVFHWFQVEIIPIHKVVLKIKIKIKIKI